MNNELKFHGQHYFESAIKTATPAKLRLMLIERSVELAGRIASQWRDGSADATGVNENTIKLLEILTELLSGVTEKENQLCQQVADLYVFLTKHLLIAEETMDAGAMDEIGLVLEVEAETWRMVCAREMIAESPASTAKRDSAMANGGLDLQG